MQDLLGREGWRVNHKPLRHVWREEGLKVPQNHRKNRRIRSTESGIVRKQSTRKNEVWGLDFIFDRTNNGISIKMFVVLDEYTRENKKGGIDYDRQNLIRGGSVVGYRSLAQAEFFA
jgi:putative transposase